MGMQEKEMVNSKVSMGVLVKERGMKMVVFNLLFGTISILTSTRDENMVTCLQQWSQLTIIVKINLFLIEHQIKLCVKVSKDIPSEGLTSKHCLMVFHICTELKKKKIEKFNSTKWWNFKNNNVRTFRFRMK